MAPSSRSGAFPLAEALAHIPGPPGAHAVSVLERGTLHLKLSCPVRPNVQAPHDQELADLGLQAAQPLRDRRLRDRQQLRRALEAARFGKGGEAFQGGRVEQVHQVR